MMQLIKLLKVHFLNASGFNKILHPRDKKERIKYTAFGITMAFVFLVCVFTSAFYSLVMAWALESAGMLELLPAVMMALSCVVVLFTSLYKAPGILFGFKDYDLLTSLPVKTRTIIASRVFILYGMNFLFCFVIMAPSAVVYAVKSQPQPLFFPIFILLMLLVPLVPIIIATVIGTLISIISARFKGKNIISLILMVGVLAAIFLFSFSAGSYTAEDFQAISASAVDIANQIYPLTGLYISALCHGSIPSLLLFALISLALFALYVWLVGYKFKALNTALTASSAKGNYKLGRLQQQSPVRALFYKECRRYFSSYLYVVNTAVGVILMTLLSIALLVFGAGQIETLLQIPGFSQVIKNLSPFMLTLFILMSCTTACSISLEGKNLWIIKSLPVKIIWIFWSKIGVNLLITLPAIVLNGVFFCIALKADFLQGLFIFLIPALAAVFISQIGLIANLHFPNFTWENETAVIKQGAATFISIMGGMLLGIALIVVLLAIPGLNPILANGLICLAFAVINGLLYLYLNKAGERIFRRLG